MFISIVSPVYKAKDCVAELCSRTSDVLKENTHINDYEIILVEDGSEDGTWEAIQSVAAQDEKIKGIKLSRNFGQHKAITAGLDHASGDWIVVMDCDLQDRPEDIPVLLEKALEGYDVVCATRKERKDHFWRVLVSKFWYNAFRWASGLDVDPKLRNYRIINRKVLESFKKIRESSQSFVGQVHWLGFNTAYIELDHGERFSGQSSYNLLKLLSLGFEFIISYTNKPLILSIYIGFSVSIISFLVFSYFFVKSMTSGVSVPGWTSLILSIWFIGGAIIANLGILGIYIGRIFVEVKGRPLYVVTKQLNIE